MDEVLVSFDMPTSRTVDAIGVKLVPVVTTGNEKKKVSKVYFPACHLEINYHLMVIFKRNTAPKETFLKSIIMLCNEKDWVNQDVMTEWA